MFWAFISDNGRQGITIWTIPPVEKKIGQNCFKNHFKSINELARWWKIKYWAKIQKTRESREVTLAFGTFFSLEYLGFADLEEAAEGLGQSQSKLHWEHIWTLDLWQMCHHAKIMREPHEKMKLKPSLAPHTHKNSGWIVDLRLKCKTMTVSKCNVGEYFHKIGKGKTFNQDTQNKHQPQKT